MLLKEKRIYLEEVRDFGSMLGDLLRFIRQNFGSIWKTLLFVGGPYVLALTIFVSLYENEIGEVHLGLQGTSKYIDYFMDSLLLNFVVLTGMYIGRAFLASVTASYMILHERHGDALTTQQVAQLLMRNTRKIMGVIGATLLLFWGIGGGLIVLGYLLTQLHEMLAAFYVIVVVIGIIIFYFPLSYVNASLYMITLREGLSGFKAIKRGFNLLKTNFWHVWLLFFVASILLWGLFYLIKQPVEIYSGIQDYFTADAQSGYSKYSVSILLLGLLATFLWTLSEGFYYFLCNFQYYSAVEKQTGNGLKRRIEQIGDGKNYRDVEPDY